jgi:hypothetical protein
VAEESRSPVHVSRAELDRVIRRATELQFSEGQGTEGELTEAEVLRIGREVGLDSEYVRRALGEVRAEALVPALPNDSGVLKRLVGDGQIRAERVVPAGAYELEEHLVHWFSEGESLRLVRRRSGTSLWEPNAGWVAQLQRGLKWQGQPYDLAQARQVELSVQPMEEGYSLVTLTLDIRNIRMEIGSGYIGGFSFLGGGIALAITVPLLTPAVVLGGCAAGMVAGALGGVGVGRSSFRGREERIRLAAEGLLDRLERGELRKSSRRR